MPLVLPELDRDPAYGGRFRATVNEYLNRAEERARQVRNLATVYLMEDIIRDTPVLTGRLQNNWRASTRYRPDVLAPNLSKTRTVNRIKRFIDKQRINRPILIFNNTPYIEFIEYGEHSKKAPQGMARINIYRWQEFINRANQDIP